MSASIQTTTAVILKGKEKEGGEERKTKAWTEGNDGGSAALGGSTHPFFKLFHPEFLNQRTFNNMVFWKLVRIAIRI